MKVQEVDHELLHRRLGHVHQRAIQKTIEMARGVKLKNNDEVENCICEACVMGKLTRGSFRKQWKNRIQDLFGRIHSDVWSNEDRKFWWKEIFCYFHG